MSDDNRLMQARCPKGHPVKFWGSPLMVVRGQVPRLYGRPIVCHCGEELRTQGGHR